MNRDSRKPGKGAKSAKRKRIVRGKAEQIAKLTAAESAQTPSPDIEPPVLNRQQLRELALDELARYAVDAAKALGESSKMRGRRDRGAGQREAAQKWLLQAVFDMVPAPEQPLPGTQGSEGGGQEGGNVVQLSDERRELMNLMRRQRRDMNK